MTTLFSEVSNLRLVEREKKIGGFLRVKPSHEPTPRTFHECGVEKKNQTTGRSRNRSKENKMVAWQPKLLLPKPFNLSALTGACYVIMRHFKFHSVQRM